MKCLRAILRVTRSDRLNTIVSRKSLNVVETIEEVIVKRQIRWFGHISRIRDMINAINNLNFTNQRPKGRPLKIWSNGIIENSGVRLLTMERRAEDREAYKYQVHMCSARDVKSYVTKSNKSYIYIYFYFCNI